MSNKLCGIRPSGSMHIGHYFSVIKPCLEHNADVLIAEYHAPNECSTAETVNLLLEFGVPESKIFLQSKTFNADVYFKLLSIARMGELKRMTQYKNGDSDDAHLFVYPVLMTHDVLGYDEILVGKDQTQHLNYARDLIKRYNVKYGFSIREPQANPIGGKIMSLTHPDKKMSKSEPDGCIFLSDSAENITRKIKAATMSDDGIKNLVAIYRNFGGEKAIPTMNIELKRIVTEKLITAIQKGQQNA